MIAKFSFFNLGIFFYFLLLSLIGCESEGQGNNLTTDQNKVDLSTDNPYLDNLPLAPDFIKVKNYLQPNTRLFLSKNGVFRVVIPTYEQEILSNPDLIEQHLRKAIITFVYRVFIHTKTSRLDMVAYPIFADNQTQSDGRPIKMYHRKLDVSREEALQALNEVANINNFEDLVGAENEKVYVKDSANQYFDAISEPNQFPGLDKIYEELFE